MNRFVLLIFLGSLYSPIFGQTTILQEDFESYQGFGSTLSNGWTSSPSGFKVYIRTMNGNSNKICETPLTNNHRKDSLITTDLPIPSGSAVLNFQSRIVDGYLGASASFSHVPAPEDELKAFLSLDGGNFAQVLDLLPSYPTNASGLNMTNFAIPITAGSGSVAKVKFVAKAKAATEWFPSFDNFSLISSADPTSISRTRKTDSGIYLIPNPASQRITILGPGYSQKANVEIFNILGNLVFSAELNGGKVIADVSNFRPGVYLVKVSEGSKTSIERLIVKQ